jgi:hypothetical protein
MAGYSFGVACFFKSLFLPLPFLIDNQRNMKATNVFKHLKQMYLKGKFALLAAGVCLKNAFIGQSLTNAGL